MCDRIAIQPQAQVNREPLDGLPVIAAEERNTVLANTELRLRPELYAFERQVGNAQDGDGL